MTIDHNLYYIWIATLLRCRSTTPSLQPTNHLLSWIITTTSSQPQRNHKMCMVDWSWRWEQPLFGKVACPCGWWWSSPHRECWCRLTWSILMLLYIASHRIFFERAECHIYKQAISFWWRLDVSKRRLPHAWSHDVVSRSCWNGMLRLRDHGHTPFIVI